jgi:galactokinase/mevalonate kinase-like predicted kinase
MAYWTVSGDRRNDAMKARETRADVARTDWDAEMLRLEKEAEKVRDVFLGKQADRMVAGLRREWEAARRQRDFVSTGINPA